MATGDQIKALVRAHFDGDNERFRGIALSIAANAERNSPVLAKALRDLADRQQHAQQLVALPTQVIGMLAMTRPAIRLDDMVLDAETRARIDRVVLEQNNRDKLAEHGFRPARKLLLVGPPGVGKTMMASALACHLDIPMLRVELHSVISSHLGETAAHLGKVFDNVRVFRGVYLFDEFDALGAERGADRTDVGEMRRVVNSLLGFIEQDDSDSLIIAATNHADLLDRAMFRRFDDVIAFPLPTKDVARRLIESRLVWNDGIDWDVILSASWGVGHADLIHACDLVSKDAILAGHDRIDTVKLGEAIAMRHPSTTRSEAQ